MNDMDVKNAIIKGLIDVVGMTEEEIAENMDVNLFECEILDSLSLAALLTEAEDLTGKKISIKDLDPEAISTVNNLIAAIEAQVK